MKIKLLIGACVVIVGILSLIQYYLVLNTYKLTKEKYYTEVKREIAKITDLPVNNIIEDKVQENLKFFTRLYVQKKINKNDFIANLKRRNDSVLHELNGKFPEEINSNKSLRGIRYKSQYDEILVTFNNQVDTLLSPKQPPFVFLGLPFQTPNTLLISNGNNTIIDNIPNDNIAGKNITIKLQILRSQYLDISSWQGEVWKRMAGIYLLAIVLILAVILLFYLVFNTMIRQKKLADIKTDFANNITHELKTPLSSIGLILKSLRRTDLRTNDHLTNELISSLDRQYDKIQQVVDFVLESAMTSNYEIKMEEVDIQKYLTEYVKEIKMESHAFSYSISSETSIINTNIQILDKILNNLIENAGKYSATGTQIVLKSYVSGKKHIIEISDTGCGISEEDKPFIFDKFFRVPTHNDHKVKGLGLGLHLSKQAANSVNANLNLKSTSQLGSTFILELKNEY